MSKIMSAKVAPSEAKMKYDEYKNEVETFQSRLDTAQKYKITSSGNFRLCTNCPSSSNENLINTKDLMLLKNVKNVLHGLNELEKAGAPIEWWLDSDIKTWIADVDVMIEKAELPNAIKIKKVKMEQFIKLMSPIEQIELIDTI